MKHLTMIFMITLAALSYADYHYASHEGSNEYPYTSWETAAHLIQDAVDATDPHDTVYIGSGQWYEAVATEYYDSIAIIGMGIDSTFMYADSGLADILYVDYDCSVEGITFEHLGDFRCIGCGLYASCVGRNPLRFRQNYWIPDQVRNDSPTNCKNLNNGAAIVIPNLIWRTKFFVHPEVVRKGGHCEGAGRATAAIPGISR